MRCRRPSILACVVAVAALSLIAAGCGGGSPRVASVTTSTTAATVTAQYGPVAFSRCMRSHGELNFPDPTSSGVFDGSKLKQLGASGQLRSVTQLRAAQSECNHLLPNGVPLAVQTITPAEQADYLRAAACLRSRGGTRFPRPGIPPQRCQRQHPVEHQPTLCSVRKRGDDLREADPQGPAQRKARRFVTRARFP